MSDLATDERQELVDRVRSIASELGTDRVPRHEFLRRSRVGERKVQRLFGSYNGLVEAAGLKPRSFPVGGSPIYDDDQLLEKVVQVLRIPDSKLTRVFFEQNADISASVCERRFGGWINTLRRAAGRLDPPADADVLSRIEEYTSAPSRAPSSIAPAVSVSQSAPRPHDEPPEMLGHLLIAGSSSNIYGEFINFRGLQHAPVNEQGVVFLFGMICRELGYVVEIVKPGFPDCEAKRRIKGKSGLWQRVRIEFEFQSRNFRAHGHDPDQCDVIVCWEHNWPECPIEVLELRTSMATLANAVSQ